MFVSSEQAYEFKTMVKALIAAYHQYQQIKCSETFGQYLFQSHICSYLTLLPQSIVDSYHSLIRERQIRVEVMNLICTRQDLLSHFFEAASFGNEDASLMLTHYFTGTTVETNASPAVSKLERLPSDFIKELVAIVNSTVSQGHKGLLT